MKNRLSLIIPLVLIIASLCFVANPSSVSLRFNASPDAGVVNYRVYYGPSSGIYTNSILTGGALSATIPGLKPKTTYYFAAAAVDTHGAESPFSNEVATWPAKHWLRLKRIGPTAELSIYGPTFHTYKVWATSNLTPPVSWTLLGTATSNATGAAQFIDTAPPASMRFYRTEDTTP